MAYEDEWSNLFFIRDDSIMEMVSSSDGVEKEEISDHDSIFGSFRSCTSSSVSENRWRPSQEIEEIDEGWITFSRMSSLRSSSVSSCYPNEPQAHSQSSKPSLFRRLFMPPRIMRMPTVTIPDWRETLNIPSLKQHISSDRPTEFKVFTKKELKKATNNYCTDCIIGEGTYSIVYKGILDDQTVVAIMKCRFTHKFNSEMFANGISILSRINNVHVVKLVGWCLEVKVPILVIEYIPNGTLFSLIFEKREEVVVFPLITRLRIAAETAEALVYLWTETSPPILHGKVSTKNILLDADYTVKLFEFGWSNLCKSNDNEDVWRFGLMLLELLTRKEALIFNHGVSFFVPMMLDRLVDILDPDITSQGLTARLHKVINLTAECLRAIEGKRPSMKEVHRVLEASIRSTTNPLVLDNINDGLETTILHNDRPDFQADHPIRSIGIDTRSAINMKKKRENKVEDKNGTISIGLWRYKHEYWSDDEPFDHSGYDGIKMIIIYCCSYPDGRINSFRIQYTKHGELEWTEKVGEDEGDRFQIVLDDLDEYIMQVIGYTCLFDGGPGLCSITFFSNRETYGSFGHNKETNLGKEKRRDYIPFEYSGGKLVGFKGTSGRYISSIGFYLQSLPQSCEKCGGKGIMSETSPTKQVPCKIQQISVGQFGISGFGKVFNHGEYDGIKRIFIAHKDYINYFKVEYIRNGQPLMTKEVGVVDMEDRASEVVLDYPNEFLETVTGSYFVTFYDHSVGLVSLTFHSNVRKYGPFGYQCGQPFEVSGGKIVGFQGSVFRGELAAIGFHIIPRKSPPPPLCDMCENSEVLQGQAK